MSDFQLSDKQATKLRTVAQESEKLHDSDGPENIVEFLANYYLIREGSTEELAEAQEVQSELRQRLDEWRESSRR